MANSTAVGHQSQSSPRLVRSKSGSSNNGTPAKTKLASSSERFSNRLKSRTKSRTSKEEEKVNNVKFSLAYNISAKPLLKQRSQENKEGFSKLFQQRGNNYSPATGFGDTKKARSVPTSPSAWALSPGRSLTSPVTPPLQRSMAGRGDKVQSNGGRKNGVSGILKYFKMKKVSPLQEDEFHRFRILHNRLLQWRFVNARAEDALISLKTDAEDKLFSIWIRIFKMRNYILERRIQMQKLKHEKKLYNILDPQVCLLNDWVKLERRNQESLGKLVTKLSAFSIRLPLVHGAKADGRSLYEAMMTAMFFMDGIEAMLITGFLLKVEKILYMVKELVITKNQQNECLEDMEKNITRVAALFAKETSFRVECIQADKELTKISQFNADITFV